MKNVILVMLLGLLSIGNLSADNYLVSTSVDALGHKVHTYTTQDGEFVYTANQFEIADNLEVIIYKDANEQVISTLVKGIDVHGNPVDVKYDSHLISRELSHYVGLDVNSTEGEAEENTNTL